MLDINTMEILQGPVARSIMQASQRTRAIVGIIFIIILLFSLTEQKNITDIMLSIIVLTGALMGLTYIATGYSYKDFVPSSYRTIIAQIDTESSQFKDTFKTTENLDHMLETFPETEQKLLDTKIVNKQGKYYFTNTVVKQYVDEVPNKAVVKRKMETDLKAYYNKMNIYTQTLVEDDEPKEQETPQEEVKQEQVPKKKIIGTEPLAPPKQTKQLDAENSPKPASFEQWLQH
jgi:hypothetical protein